MTFLYIKNSLFTFLPGQRYKKPRKYANFIPFRDLLGAFTASIQSYLLRKDTPLYAFIIHTFSVEKRVYIAPPNSL